MPSLPLLPCQMRGPGGNHSPRRGLGRSPGAFAGVRGGPRMPFLRFLPFLSFSASYTKKSFMVSMARAELSKPMA